MRQCVTLLCLIISFFGLTACGKYHGGYGERYYKVTDRAAPPVTVPHGIASPVGEQLYPVPKVHTTASSKVSLTPPDPTLRAALAQKKAAKKAG